MTGFIPRSATTCGLACALLLSSACSDWWRWLPEPGEEEPTTPVAGRGDVSDAGVATPTKDPTLPKATAECPQLAQGTVELLGIPVRLWVGRAVPEKKGPLLIYWHGTGSSPAEAPGQLGEAFAGVLEEGGVIAALAGTTQQGDNTSTGTWFTGDNAIVDEVVACATQQFALDERRIYTAGCSSGGIQAGVLARQRASYIAAAGLNSGGTVRAYALDDPNHPVPTILSHGARGNDVVIVDFAEISQAYAEELAAVGGFAVECDHGGGHCGIPPALKAAQWDFLRAHPFGLSPEPYADGLPASYPRYCKIIR
jgi:hypothetical protein